MSITVMKHLDSQRPDRKPDYLGKVEAVSENTVTLALAEIPAGIFLSPGERAQAKAQQQAGSQAPPEGGRQKMTLKLTGKTKDILFASNTKIVRFYKDAGHPCLQSLELKEIEKGNVLTVWMQDNHAVYVQVSRRKV
jgi:hypothetical protein